MYMHIKLDGVENLLNNVISLIAPLTPRFLKDCPSNYVFNIFNSNKLSSIDFKKFIYALSVINSKISYKEILAIIKLPVNEDTPKKRVKKIFRIIDKNKNSSLDIKEFKEGSKHNEIIILTLSLYDGLF
ncbi:hypothetical protein BKA64DRAFT_691447 [Cadophora sp. MPI-SDFR-AT-0126]|nr:hypothetical protein BKA64DRAFT_691447 [Leotiomycetes sp. MPI-SDFR-AT-0126]